METALHGLRFAKTVQGCSVVYAKLYAVFPKAIPHKERLATLHAICLQISRHISQKCS